MSVTYQNIRNHDSRIVIIPLLWRKCDVYYYNGIYVLLYYYDSCAVLLVCRYTSLPKLSVKCPPDNTSISNMIHIPLYYLCNVTYRYLIRSYVTTGRVRLWRNVWILLGEEGPMVKLCIPYFLPEIDSSMSSMSGWWSGLSVVFITIWERGYHGNCKNQRMENVTKE